MANHKIEIKAGDRFGRLTVIGECGKNASGKYVYHCICACGAEKLAVGSELKRGYVKSCGCYKTDCARNSQGYHGLTKKPIYTIWSNMLQRCTNRSSIEYSQYGGRGISVCDEWQNFMNFYRWAKSSGYRDGLSIERVDVNGNYCPENCTFIRLADQCLNKQNTIRYKGEVLKRVCARLGLKYSSVHSRIKKLGWSVERAVETPFKGG